MTTRTIATSATALLLLGAVVAVAIAGVDFAAGFAISGALMLVNLALWKATVARLIRGALGGGGAVGTVLLLGVKFALLLVGLFILVQRFDGLAVLLGSSIVVACLMALAAIGLVTELQVQENC